jgi:endonuclease/exonuclease/phosphatase family metal-dependent hydrolase
MMKIIFLNVWGGKRKTELAEYIRDEAQDTDVFCFQEATAKMKHDNRDVFSGWKEVSDYKFISENDDMSQTIYIKEGVEVLSSGVLLASDMETGLGIYVEIKTRNSSLYICNVHGIARPGDKLDTRGRLRQSKEIIEFFEGKDRPAIIGGDFNILPDAASIKMFTEHGYQDLIHKFGIDTTRNHFIWDHFPDNIQYYSDYVFLNDKVQCKDFSVPKNEISDHLPLILKI